MLGDSEIQALNSHLGAAVRDNERHHDDLQNLFEKFHDLLESYNFLKTDYEEAKEARDRYKKQARGQVSTYVYIYENAECGDGLYANDGCARNVIRSCWYWLMEMGIL